MFWDDGHPRVSGIRIKPKYLSRAVLRAKRDATLAPHMKKKNSARLLLPVLIVVSCYRALQSHSPSLLGRYWSLWSPPPRQLPPYHRPAFWLQSAVFPFQPGGEKEEEDGGGRWETENTVRENRGPLVCVQVLNPSTPRPPPGCFISSAASRCRCVCSLTVLQTCARRAR